MTSPSPTKFPGRHLALAVVGFAAVAAHGQTVPAPGRGELLYTTHCIACHTAEMHWRGNRRTQDWESLKRQVRLWQGNTGLQWDEADIAAVAGYLNDTIYRYPRTAPVGLRQAAVSPDISVVAR